MSASSRRRRRRGRLLLRACKLANLAKLPNPFALSLSDAKLTRRVNGRPSLLAQHHKKERFSDRLRTNGVRWSTLPPPILPILGDGLFRLFIGGGRGPLAIQKPPRCPSTILRMVPLFLRNVCDSPMLGRKNRRAAPRPDRRHSRRCRPRAGTVYWSRIAFLETLAVIGSVRSAAKRVGVAPDRLSRAAAPPPSGAWDAAMVVARAQAEAGCPTAPWKDTRKRSGITASTWACAAASPSACCWRSGRLDRYAADERIDPLAEDFDGMIDRMRAGEPIDAPPPELAPAPEPETAPETGAQADKVSSCGQCHTRSMSPPDHEFPEQRGPLARTGAGPGLGYEDDEALEALELAEVTAPARAGARHSTVVAIIGSGARTGLSRSKTSTVRHRAVPTPHGPNAASVRTIATCAPSRRWTSSAPRACASRHAGRR